MLLGESPHTSGIKNFWKQIREMEMGDDLVRSNTKCVSSNKVIGCIHTTILPCQRILSLQDLYHPNENSPSVKMIKAKTLQ